MGVNLWGDPAFAKSNGEARSPPYENLYGIPVYEYYQKFEPKARARTKAVFSQIDSGLKL
jgi:hypothetical protein